MRVVAPKTKPLAAAAVALIGLVAFWATLSNGGARSRPKAPPVVTLRRLTGSGGVASPDPGLDLERLAIPPFAIKHCTGLYAVDPSTRARRTLVSTPAYPDEEVSAADWSPRRREMAYALRRGGLASSMFLLRCAVPDTDGQLAPHEIITAGYGIDDEPQWSPDAKRIAFIKAPGDSGAAGAGSAFAPDLWVADTPTATDSPLEGSGSVSAVSARCVLPDVREAVWSPDGQRLAFAASVSNLDDGILGVVDADGGNREDVQRGMRCSSPAWSPDGSTIAFVGYQNRVPRVFVVNADGSGARQLTHAPHSDEVPAWSPDGRTIAFLAEARVSEGPGSRSAGAEEATHKVPMELWTMARDGSRQKRIAAGGDYRPPIWSPDGSRIAACVEPDAGSFALVAMRPDGSDVWELATSETPMNLVWMNVP